MYGNYVEKWIGQKITLWPTVTQMNNENVECIRVRPTIPNGKAKAKTVGEQIMEKMQEQAAIDPPAKDGE